MKQPYRSPDTIVEPPERVEAVTLRRYPIWVQVFWLALLPIAALVVAQLFPSMTLVCAGEPYCMLEEARLTGTRHYALLSPNALWIREDAADALASDDVHLLVTGRLVPSEDGPERFSFEISAGEARRIRLAHDGLTDIRAPLRRMGWLHGLFAFGELSLVVFFVLAQRRIRIQVNADTGEVTVDDRRYFRPARHRSVNLGAVKTLDLAFLGEVGDGHGRRVLVHTRTGPEPYELYEAFEDEARRGLQLVERSFARWTEEHA